MSEWAVFLREREDSHRVRHVFVLANTELEALEAGEAFMRGEEIIIAAHEQPTWEGPTPLKN